MTGIYYITNKENDKIYVVCSGNIEKRWEQHLEMLRSKKHHSYKLQNAYNEFGEENFKMTIEEECRFEDRFLIEARHIRKNKGISKKIQKIYYMNMWILFGCAGFRAWSMHLKWYSIVFNL